MAHLRLLRHACCVALAALTCSAKTVTHDFRVSWVTGNPDGMFERRVVGINGQWPLPVIEVDKGDRLIVNMHNDLDTHSASIHWHGMFQNGTSYMDGPSMVTQCPVVPGQSITYNFTIEQPGTYWYHCHTDYCYPDGYRQALIVHDKDAFFNNDYEEELVLTMTDWYHDLQDKLSKEFMSLYNPSGAEPIPNAFLLNDTTNTKIDVKPNKTYFIRLINIAAFVGQYIWFEDHDFKIVEIDGVYTEPANASMLYLGPAQRYGILLTTKNTTDKNFPIVTVADASLLDAIPADLQLNQTNWLQYDKKADFPQGKIPVDDSTKLAPFDDLKLVSYDKQPLFPEPDVEVDLTLTMQNLMTGDNYAMLNDITFTAPKVPFMYTVMSSGDTAGNVSIYGDYTNAVVLKKNQIVQVVLNNDDSGAHPFHLHGHNFQLLDRSPPMGSTFYDLADNTDGLVYNPKDHGDFPKYPARRDTFVVPPMGYFVIRFVADNPGTWLFHCHIDWHLSSGLAMVFIEAPEQMQEQLTIPEDHYAACAAANIPIKGNAAGNSEDFFDLSGQNKQAAFLPSGFTARGIVALVFSVVSAVLGIVSITIYGLADLKPKKATLSSDELSQEGSNSDGVLTQTVGVNTQEKGH